MMRLNAITACMAWSMLKVPPTKESHPATMAPSAAAIGVHRPRKINPALTAPTSLKKSVVASATPDHVETSNGVPAARRNSSRPHPGQLLGKVENMRCMDCVAEATWTARRAADSNRACRSYPCGLLWGENPPLQGQRHRMRAIICAELCEDALEVSFDGVL